jgi:heparosan-N-sulfate-glucuronate 5-epimerase
MLTLLAIACLAPDGVGAYQPERTRAAGQSGVLAAAPGAAARANAIAYEGPYNRAGIYDVFPAVPEPGWQSPYKLRGGIPVVHYPGLGNRRNPVTAAQYGLARWSTGVKYNDPEEIAVAEHVARWFVKHQQANGEWTYSFRDVIGPGPELTLEPPWASALAQGQAISLLTRLYRHTHDTRYLRSAEAALAPLLRQVSQGGLQTSYEGGAWLEEAPTTKPAYILNGFLMTIVGVYDLSDLDPAAQTLFDETVPTAAASLPAFDNGEGSSWYDLTSRYGVKPHIPKAGYGPIIVKTLEVLNTLSPHEAFLHYANAWANEP